jgi:hypothetical protein
MRCLFNVHGSQMELFFRLVIIRCWKEHQNFYKTKPKSMRQTFCMPQPMSLYHSISHPYGPNKQYLMDEMPIQYPWEPLFGQESRCHIYLFLSNYLEYELSLYFTTSTRYHCHLPQPSNCVYQSKTILKHYHYSEALSIFTSFYVLSLKIACHVSST